MPVDVVVDPFVRVVDGALRERHGGLAPFVDCRVQSARVAARRRGAMSVCCDKTEMCHKDEEKEATSTRRVRERRGR